MGKQAKGKRKNRQGWERSPWELRKQQHQHQLTRELESQWLGPDFPALPGNVDEPLGYSCTGWDELDAVLEAVWRISIKR